MVPDFRQPAPGTPPPYHSATAEPPNPDSSFPMAGSDAVQADASSSGSGARSGGKPPLDRLLMNAVAMQLNPYGLVGCARNMAWHGRMLCLDVPGYDVGKDDNSGEYARGLLDQVVQSCLEVRLGLVHALAGCMLKQDPEKFSCSEKVSSLGLTVVGSMELTVPETVTGQVSMLVGGYGGVLCESDWVLRMMPVLVKSVRACVCECMAGGKGLHGWVDGCMVVMWVWVWV